MKPGLNKIFKNILKLKIIIFILSLIFVGCFNTKKNNKEIIQIKKKGEKVFAEIELPNKNNKEKLNLHSPEIIKKIADESYLKYIIEQKEEIEMEYEKEMIFKDNIYYQELEDGRIYVKKYEYDIEIIKEILKAEYYIKNRYFEKARECYKKIIEQNNDFYQIYTNIAYTYFEENNFKAAKIFLDEAIEKNFIDYRAHHISALNYLFLKKPKIALEEIIKAHILNRNDKYIYADLIEIAALNNFKVENWEFEPSYSVNKENEKVYIILEDIKMISYVLCKALWKYEPEYKESKKTEWENLEYYEEMEALYNLAVSDEKTENEKDEKDEKYYSLIKLKGAFKNENFEEYAVYEVFLKRMPYMIYYSPINIMDELCIYFKEYHLK